MQKLMKETGLQAEDIQDIVNVVNNEVKSYYYYRFVFF